MAEISAALVKELRDIARVCTESCCQVDPESTEKMLESMHAEADVLSVAHEDDGTHVRAKVSPVLRAELDPYIVA